MSISRRRFLTLTSTMAASNPFSFFKADTTYQWHHDVVTTMFWVGEAASSDNQGIHNISSAWMSDWKGEFGCIDHPDSEQRWGYAPLACFADGQEGSNENLFYVALPFGDYDQNGALDQVKQIPWYEEENGDEVYATGGSLLKNRWIQIVAVGDDGVERTCFGQWADVGPFNWSDAEYVWGNANPAYQDPVTGERIGLDVSPAINDYLRLNGKGVTSWRFVNQEEVPGDSSVWWKTVITTSPPKWK